MECLSKEDLAICVENLSFSYGQENLALRNICLNIVPNQVTSLIGPSGCGKSTLLRCFNRMNDIIPYAKVCAGKILIFGENIYSPSINVASLRRSVGMVFQKSNPFPKSIYENIAYGMRLYGKQKKSLLDETVFHVLSEVGLWEEVKDRLDENALHLSGGQQQRLCIARAIVVSPKIILMDEPCSALDPVASAKVEELIMELAKKFAIVIVTHNLQQALRISRYSAFLSDGEVIEYSLTQEMFEKPKKTKTEAYISGKFG